MSSQCHPDLKWNTQQRRDWPTTRSNYDDSYTHTQTYHRDNTLSDSDTHTDRKRHQTWPLGSHHVPSWHRVPVGSRRRRLSHEDGWGRPAGRFVRALCETAALWRRRSPWHSDGGRCKHTGGRVGIPNGREGPRIFWTECPRTSLFAAQLPTHHGDPTTRQGSNLRPPAGSHKRRFLHATPLHPKTGGPCQKWRARADHVLHGPSGPTAHRQPQQPRAVPRPANGVPPQCPLGPPRRRLPRRTSLQARPHPQ